MKLIMDNAEVTDLYITMLNSKRGLITHDVICRYCYSMLCQDDSIIEEGRCYVLCDKSLRIHYI